MPTITVPAVTINDDGKGALPTRLADEAANLLSSARVIAQALGAQTANGNSASFSLKGIKSLLSLLRVTAVSGTSPTLNVFLDTSDDGGTTWYQVAQLGPANIAAVPATPEPNTYLLTTGLGSSSGDHGDTIRYRWTIAGTSPSFTLQVTYIPKP